MNQVSKSFHYTWKSILHGKLRNFFKRSLWRYFLASIILSYGWTAYIRGAQTNFLNHFFIIFAGLIALGLSAIIVSSFILVQNYKQEDVEITFKQDGIEIRRGRQGIRETKSWEWIKKFEEADGIYYFDLNVWPRNVLIIGKKRFTSEEDDALRELLVANGKLKG